MKIYTVPSMEILAANRNDFVAASSETVPHQINGSIDGVVIPEKVYTADQIFN